MSDAPPDYEYPIRTYPGRGLFSLRPLPYLGYLERVEPEPEPRRRKRKKGWRYAGNTALSAMAAWLISRGAIDDRPASWKGSPSWRAFRRSP